MVNLFRWLFGHVSTFGHLCSCGEQAYVQVPDRMDESACIECRCGKLWSFVWKMDHWDVKCWVPEFRPEPAGVNVQTSDAAADFKRRRESGEFGPRTNEEVAAMFAEDFGPHDMG